MHTLKCGLVAGWGGAQVGRHMGEGAAATRLLAFLDEKVEHFPHADLN